LNKAVVNVGFIFDRLLAELKVGSIVINEHNPVVAKFLRAVAVVFDDMQVVGPKWGHLQPLVFQNTKVLEEEFKLIIPDTVVPVTLAQHPHQTLYLHLR
jgi:hypothetical protein